MVYYRPVDTIDPMVAEHINQIIKAWEGDTGSGNPMVLVLNNAAQFTQIVQQLDATVGQIAEFRRDDGSPMLSITRNGAILVLSTAVGASATPVAAVVGGVSAQGLSQSPSRADHIHRIEPVATAGLASNAAAQMTTQAATAGATTASTANVGLPHDGTNQMGITYTTSGLSGSWVELEFSVGASHSVANGRTVFGYQIDSGGVVDLFYPPSPSSAQMFTSIKVPLPGLAAGSHLFRIWWRVLDAGTATMVSVGTRLTITEHKR